MEKKRLVIALTFMILGLILITPALTKAQDASEFTVPLSDPGKRAKLKANINSGSITVKGTARKDILVKYQTSEGEEGDKGRHHRNRNDDRRGSDTPKSKEGLKRIGGSGMDLEVVEDNNNVKVKSNSWSKKVDLEIEVPSGTDLEVSTYNDGDIMVTNIQGQTELTNYNGEITALNISGSVVATTYNGEIKVTFDKVTEGAPMSYSTYNGDVDITFPSTLKATLKMKTEQGEIYTDFDIKLTSTGPVQKKDTSSGVYRVIVDDWKRGDVNGGGAEVTVKNYNGDIYIRKK
jgi:hypothetical protein